MHSIFALLTGDVLKVDVAHCGQIAAAANLVVLIVEVNFQHRLGALSHGDVACVDVFDHAAAASVGLYAYHSLKAGTVHLVVLGKHIAASAGNLTADNHTAVSILHLAVADDDVLARFVPQSSVVVSSALNGNAVVAGVEETVLDEHAVTRLGVAAVAVGSVVVDVYAAHGDVFRQQRVYHPERRAQQRHVFYEYAIALVQVDELWAQSVLRAESSFIHVYAVLGLLEQLCTATHVLPNHACAPSVAWCSAPFPPSLVGAAAVNHAFARYGNVVLPVGIYTW